MYVYVSCPDPAEALRLHCQLCPRYWMNWGGMQGESIEREGARGESRGGEELHFVIGS